MTTQEAIQALQAVAATLTDEVTGSQAKLDAITLAIQQLQGILDTPSADLEAAQATIEQLQKQVDDAAAQPADPTPDPIP